MFQIQVLALENFVDSTKAVYEINKIILKSTKLGGRSEKDF